MKRAVILGLKILAGVVGVLLVLLVATCIAISSKSMQNSFKDYAMESLSERLETKVSIDSISINFFTFDVNLHGVNIEDQQHRKMFEAGTLAINLDIWGVIFNNITVSSARFDNVHARLFKPENGPANFQFVLDAFKSDKPKKKKEKKKASDDKKSFTFDINDVEINHLGLLYDGFTKKGPQTISAEIGKLTLEGKRRHKEVKIDSLHFILDNHKPRKNEGKPKRGWFDVGHFDVLAHMEFLIHHFATDSLNLTLQRCEALDSLTGFNVKDLRFKAGVNFKKAAELRDITVQQKSTVLTFDSATVVLPNKKQGRRFSFTTSKIKGKTQLKDISRPFAPVLKNFTQPLELTVLFSGTDTTLVFRDINVWSPDSAFKLHAEGGIEHLNKKMELDIHFHVDDMQTTAVFAEKIINMFTVKKLMMKQMKNLGNISYIGDVSILYKKEAFKGQLRTGVGNLDIDFYIDGNDKYIIGNATTPRIHLGKVLEMSDISDVSLKKGSFKVDIDKPRTLLMRQKYGGKLPIGNIDVIVGEAGYKGIKVRDLLLTAKSNGCEVDGNIAQQNKGLDWACDFIIPDIDKMSSIKVKPKVKVKVKDIINFDKLNPFKKKKKKEE